MLHANKTIQVYRFTETLTVWIDQLESRLLTGTSPSFLGNNVHLSIWESREYGSTRYIKNASDLILAHAKLFSLIG